MTSAKAKSEFLLPLGVIGLILLIIVPVTPFLLDLLLSFSFVLSIITLFSTLYVKRAASFSSFPSLLLFLAFFRLGLNIASSRLILSEAEGCALINTFGHFVTGNNPFVGFIVFLFLMAINFIVITKGAGRMAEVAARFNLEAIPGKQMAIDAELKAAIITPDEAKYARKKIEDETAFYGAMDGASKFVRGEAIVSLLIIAINMVAACILALSKPSNYLPLIIGDGLVTQIPSVVVSLAAALILTKVTSESLVTTLPKQLMSHKKSFLVVSLLMLVLGWLPGMPKMLFFLMSGSLFFLSFQKKEKGVIEVRLGKDKIFMLSKLNSNKWRSAYPFLPEIGVICDRKMEGYQIAIKGRIFQGKDHDIERDLENLLRQNAFQFITRDYVAKKIEELRECDEALVSEMIAKKIPYGLILKVLQNLVKERVPILDFAHIVSLVVDSETVDSDKLTENIRKQLKGVMFHAFFKDTKDLTVITLDPEVEEMIALVNQKIKPKTLGRLETMVAHLKEKGELRGLKPIILTSEKSRLPLARLLEKKDVPIFAFTEIDEEIQLQTLGTITNDILI